MKNQFSKIISLILILGLFLPSFALLPSKNAHAQSGGTTGGAGGSYTGGSYGIYSGSGGVIIGGQNISFGEIGSSIVGCLAGEGGVKEFLKKAALKFARKLSARRAAKIAERALERANKEFEQNDLLNELKNELSDELLNVSGLKAIVQLIGGKSTEIEKILKGLDADAASVYTEAKSVEKQLQKLEVVATGANTTIRGLEDIPDEFWDEKKVSYDAMKEIGKLYLLVKVTAETISQIASAVSTIETTGSDTIEGRFVPVKASGVEASVTENIWKLMVKLEDLKRAIKDNEAATKDVEEKISKANLKEQCFDGIWTAIAKVFLRNFTAATIEWINTGFLEKTINEECSEEEEAQEECVRVEEKKKPLYLEDTKEFFENIWEQETRGFANFLLEHPDDFPFGEAVAKSLMASISRRFEDQARFTLREFVRGGDYEAYYLDFRLGGWPAWLALTQLPANNPIGFRFLAAEERGRRTRGPQRLSLAEELNLDLRFSGGFLSIKECVRATPKGQQLIDNGTFKDAGDLPAKNREYCARYAVQTPGQAAADLLNITLGTGFRQAELADEMNEALAAIFDAFLAKLVNKGLSEIDKQWFEDAEKEITDVGIGQGTVTDSIGGTTTEIPPDDIIDIPTEDQVVEVSKAFIFFGQEKVEKDALDEIIAKFDMTSSFDEEVTISSLKVGFTSPNAQISNLLYGRILVDGNQVSDSVINLNASGTTYTVTDLTIDPLSSVTIEIRADIFSDFDNDTVNDLVDGDKITVSLLVGSNNAEEGGESFNVPEEDISADEIIILGIPITLEEDTSYSNQTIQISSFPQTDFEIGRWTLSGNITRDISIQTLSFDINDEFGVTFNENNISEMYVMYGTNQLISFLGVTGDGQNNIFFVFEVLPPGDSIPETVTISFFATLDVDPDLDPPVLPISGDSFKIDLTIEAYDMTTFETVEIEDIDGQTITAQ